MSKDELLKEAMKLLEQANKDTRTELKIRLSIPKLIREYTRLQENELQS